ncbi:DsrE family protein [Chitinophaga sp. 22321]|uniref:DsrE family protein n=1 Tax=Chitinophaga hostae TaxID=2831022 RepID=A0ABS5J6H7_9BACT|nr:DsrE family protein [Chitinophaga hostae]MBS0030182.1 DsrE family protein [Chitinophaga hostae]
MQVVFQITSADQDVQLSMLGQLHNLLHEAEAGKKSIAVEVVVHGQAWNLLLANANPLSGKVQSLQERSVKFLICQNTLNGRQLQVEQLLPGTEVVPAAIYHLVKRQQLDGWAYIRC